MVYVDTKSCDGCGLCAEACPHGAIKLTAGVAEVDPELCRETGACLEVCPTGALLLVTEPAEEKENQPVPVRAAPLVKQTAAPIAKPPVGVGAWLGSALVYLASDVVPQIFGYWLERRRRPSSPAPIGPRPMGRGRGAGQGKRRRRRRKGRSV
jgi:NAD-dependent dihydropyrimidine dehydrogenase PreA subunit